jgi:hypothetical protein
MAQTFNANFQAVAFAASKPMAAVLNAHATEVIKVRRIYLNNVQTVAVTGVACVLELRHYSVNPTLTTPAAAVNISFDSTNTAPTTLTLSSAASLTGGTLTGVSKRVFWSSDEPAISSATSDELECVLPLNVIYEWQPHSDIQPITLRNGQGLVLFNVTGAAGLVDVYVEYTKE